MLRASTIIPEGSLRSPRVAVIGAGIAGLVAAVDLAHAGFHVMLFEQAAGPGGKMREVEVDGLRMDAGPTVFTLRRVFDEIFADAGERLEDHVTLKRADVLARHAWDAESRLDLHADAAQSADAIARFAGAGEKSKLPIIGASSTLHGLRAGFEGFRPSGRTLAGLT